MSTFSLNSSHIGSLPQPNQNQIWSRKPSDQLSKRSAHSTGTVQRPGGRKASAASVGSAGSRSAGPLRVVNENIPPSSRSTSYASLTPFEKTESRSGSRTQLKGFQLTTARDSAISLSPGHSKPASSLFIIDGTFQDIDLNKPDIQLRGEGVEIESLTHLYRNGVQNHQALISDGAPSLASDVEAKNDQSIRGRTSISGKRTGSTQIHSRKHSSIESSENGSNPIRRLMDGFLPQRARNKGQLTSRRERWSLDDFEDDEMAGAALLRPSKFVSHRKASSWSSSGVLTPAKAVSQDGATLAQNSERASKLRFLIRSSRSSKVSEATQRASVDAGVDIPRMIDEMAHHRAVQRRKILEEIHSSEEGYINDLKVLAHVSDILNHDIVH